MYMIEIILLNQSKLSLLGVIRQIPLHAQFHVTLFDNSTIFLLLQQFIIQSDVCSVLFTYQTNRNISRTKSDMEKLYMEFLYHFKSSFK